MTNLELAAKATEVATKYSTLYVLGCFGAPLNEKNKKRYTHNRDFNEAPDRAAMIAAASPNTFGWDCVCLIKGLLWGWHGDVNDVYGGAEYKSNGVPDIGADEIIKVCKNVSTNFDQIEIGELCWMKGHVGLYIGNGLAVECSPKWENKVQITACNRNVTGYNRRNWTSHGKLPYVTYVTSGTPAPEPIPTPNTPTTGADYEVKQSLWIRESPVDGKGLAVMPAGAKVTKLSNPWVKIRYVKDGKVYEGWSSLPYLKEL